MTSAGDIIRNAREAAGLTQAELARAVGTSQPAISRYEQGKNLPSRRAMERVMNACSKKRQRPRDVLLEHREQVIDILRKYGAQKVVVFGSVARGEDDESSDIDLLVDRFDEDAYEWLQPKAEAELESLLGVKVDVGEARYLRKAVLAEAIKDACAL